MTIHQAAAFWVPLGEHRGRPLACVALDHPAYLERLAEGKAAECKPGTAFHTAVTLVVEQLHRNEDEAIVNGRTVSTTSYRRSVAELVARNAVALGREVPVEEGKGREGTRGKGKSTPASSATPASLPAGDAGLLF